jgi:hypothetical protein
VLRFSGSTTERFHCRARHRSRDDGEVGAAAAAERAVIRRPFLWSGSILGPEVSRISFM